MSIKRNLCLATVLFSLVQPVFSTEWPDMRRQPKTLRQQIAKHKKLIVAVCGALVVVGSFLAYRSSLPKCAFASDGGDGISSTGQTRSPEISSAQSEVSESSNEDARSETEPMTSQEQLVAQSWGSWATSWVPSWGWQWRGSVDEDEEGSARVFDDFDSE